MYSPFMLSSGMLGLGLAAGSAIFIIILIWALFWKGIALWSAARNRQKWWFIALLLINTAGILEIIYLFAFRTDRTTRPFASLFSFDTPKTPSI